MCGRYFFSGDNGDSKMKALIDGMEKKYPGAYKTGEIFPGDTAPAMIAVENRILPCPAAGDRPLAQALGELALLAPEQAVVPPIPLYLHPAVRAR